MQRILIIGNAGSGKTTFAKKLAGKTDLPLVHLDSLYWTGNWEHVERETFDALLEKELKKPNWIIDGNFNRTLPLRLQYCDTVFYFDVPTVTCIWGITKRIIKNYGRTRSDMGGNCPEYFDRQKIALYRNVLSFNKQHRVKYKEMILSEKRIEVIIFKSRREVNRFLNETGKYRQKM